MMRRALLLYIGIAVSILLLFGLNLTTGSVQIPFADVLDILCGRFAGKESWQYIILENRLPQALTALLCGASLSVCGLMLQTAFRNPLAGPDVFGISSGAGLGVALVRWNRIHFTLYSVWFSCHSHRRLPWSNYCYSPHPIPLYLSAK